MKTTAEIADSLLSEAKKLAARERTTVRTLIEQGLRSVIAQRKQQTRFKLRKATFKGKGLNPELRPASWDSLRKIACEGRGG